MPSIEQLENLLRSDPDDTFVLYGLAQEYAKAGDTDASVAHYDRVIALDPHYHYAYFHKARALDEDGRTDEAVETLRAGLAKAQEAGEAKASNEIAGLLDELT
ncbi:MAG: tetratricopeptide repeat protein [Planctomycetota bacterium]